MALNIKDPETDRLARDLATLTGESITVAVNKALRERIEGIQGAPTYEERRAAVRRIQEHIATLPVLDDRTADEIIGYDENGLPT